MSKQNEERIGKLILWRNDLVGQGRYGSVLKGKYESEKVVAVKIIKKKNSKLDVKKILKAGNHGNIAHFFGVEEDPEAMYILPHIFIP